MKTKKYDNGFTLVELIIVIAIMAILSAAIAPAVIGYIEKARKADDVQTAKIIYDAVNFALASGDDEVEDAWINDASNEGDGTMQSTLTGHNLRPVAWARGVKVGDWQNSLYKCAHNGAGEQPFVDEMLEALAQDAAKGKGNSWDKNKPNAYDGKSSCLTPLKYGKKMDGHRPECWIIYRDVVTNEPEIYIGYKSGAVKGVWRMWPETCKEYK